MPHFTLNYLSCYSYELGQSRDHYAKLITVLFATNIVGLEHQNALSNKTEHLTRADAMLLRRSHPRRSHQGISTDLGRMAFVRALDAVLSLDDDVAVCVPLVACWGPAINERCRFWAARHGSKNIWWWRDSFERVDAEAFLGLLKPLYPNFFFFIFQRGLMAVDASPPDVTMVSENNLCKPMSHLSFVKKRRRRRRRSPATAASQRIVRKYRKFTREFEYRRLKMIVPAVANKDGASKV